MPRRKMCTCGKCEECRSIKESFGTRFPKTFDAALRRYNRDRHWSPFAILMWPPVKESIKELDEQFPWLKGAL